MKNLDTFSQKKLHQHFVLTHPVLIVLCTSREYVLRENGCSLNLFYEVFYNSVSQPTMLQKLSKCEVKAWLCWNMIISPSLCFYVKSHFGKFKRSENVIFDNFCGSEIFIFSKLEQLSSSKFTKNSKFRVYKIDKNDTFGPFEFTKIGFHIKSEWQ